MAAEKPEAEGSSGQRTAAALPSTESGGTARALWYWAVGRAALCDESLPLPARDEVLVRTSWGGISRGTERLVFRGRVPASEYERMRAPHQRGAFPFPVKYGYSAVGMVEAGPEDVLGRTVFCLHPHQDRFVAPRAVVALLPEGVPPRRAILAANMETALNALWDAGASAADRIVVVGGGVVGLLIARLASRLPGTEVTVVDVDPGRRGVAEELGARFALSADCAKGADVVFHTSATPEGLAAAIEAAGDEASVVEVSWHGAGNVPVPLGGAFHSRRLRIVSSQVGRVPAERRARWSRARRLAAALALLDDPTLDLIITGEVAFEDLPDALPKILAFGATGLATAVRYGRGRESAPPSEDGGHARLV